MESREQDLASAKSSTADVIVIGGGIAGACAAWDAAQRGLKTILLERGDFGGATSAHSLKFLHGGVRYLQHLDIPRLRTSCRERSNFVRIAPHLTKVVPIVVPTAGIGLEGKMAFRAALFLLSILTYDRNKRLPDPDRQFPIGSIIGRQELRERFPGVVKQRTNGAAVIFDGQIVNPPRLVLAAVRSAVENGAIALNYCAVTGLDTENGQVVGVAATDRETGENLTIATRSVINAAGPFIPEVFGANAQIEARKNLVFSRDMAFVVDCLFEDDAAIAVQTKYRDPDAVISRGNRHLFMVPWREYTLIGVNSKIYEGSPNVLTVSEDEIGEFLDEINQAYPDLKLTRADINVVNAGLLPADEDNEVGGNVSFGKRSIVTDHAKKDGLRGLVSAMSVRWTTGRATAEKAVNIVEKQLNGKISGSRTATTPVHGAGFDTVRTLTEEISSDAVIGSLPEGAQNRIATNYGSDWRSIKSIIEAQPSTASTITDSAVTAAEVLFAMRHEAALHLNDVVLRRTELGSGSQPSTDSIRECAGLMQQELGWSAEQLSAELGSLESAFPFSNTA